MLFYLLFAVSAVIVLAWRRLYPNPYPGIPYNEESARRIAGDIPSLIPFIKAINENSSSIFAITTQKFGTLIV